MVKGDIAALASVRRARVLVTLGQLDDDELHARVDQSYRDGERTIEEWHAFLDARDRAMGAMRASRRRDRQSAAAMGRLAS